MAAPRLRQSALIFRERSWRARSSGALRAAYVWGNIFSIAGVAGVAVGHVATSVSK